MNYSVESGWNASNITLDLSGPARTPSGASGDPCGSGMELMRYVCEVWIVIPIALFGIVGNILAFVVLWKQRQRLTTTIILQWLAFVDTLILVSIIPMRSLWITFMCHGFPPDYKEPWKMIYRIFFPTTFALRMIDTWLITFLTLDRWIAVCRPLHASRICTRRSTYIRIVILIACAMLFSIPRYFESTQYGFLDHTYEGRVLNDFPAYVLGYQVVAFFIFMYLIPMTLLVVLNVSLILALSRANASLAGRRHSHASATNAQHRGITVIVITVVTTCVLCNLLAMLSHLLFSLEKFHASESLVASLETYRRPMAQISNIMIALNSAINFALYCFSSKAFRQATIKTLCPCAAGGKCVGGYRRVTQNITMQTSNTEDTDLVPTRNGSNSGSENGIKLKRVFKNKNTQ